MPEPVGEKLDSVFEERAEFLSRTNLVNWTRITSANRKTLTKLKGPGAKLLTGPRGSGKSTLMKAAYYELFDGSDALPVYVNYARSMALEPLFHRTGNALQIFRQWIVMKAVIGVQDTFRELQIPSPASLDRLAGQAESYIGALTVGQDPPALETLIGPTQLTDLVADWSRQAGRRRAVLFLDDAAHAFSPQQQREFFEIFRELRTRAVAPKAAVYPGITSYSPYLHVGNDAELVEAWFRSDSDDFLDTMRSIIEQRLPHRLRSHLEGRGDLIDYLALASFGLPRGFLVMLSSVLGLDDDESASSLATPSKKDADSAVGTHADTVRSIFDSLGQKMPRYRNFVAVGDEVEQQMLAQLRRFNVGKDLSEKAVVIAIALPIANELIRVLDMLEYSGTVRKLDTVSRGVKGVFQRYEMHYALVVQKNALSLGRSPSVPRTISALRARNAHAFVRTTGQRLVAGELAERCTLDLDPCQACGAPRLNEEAQFCMKCGSRLSEASIYEELLKAPIERLPLTPNKLTALKNGTAIRRVKDVLLDQESTEILKAHYVGPYWAKRIQLYAEEYVNV